MIGRILFNYVQGIFWGGCNIRVKQRIHFGLGAYYIRGGTNFNRPRLSNPSIIPPVVGPRKIASDSQGFIRPKRIACSRVSPSKASSSQCLREYKCHTFYSHMNTAHFLSVLQLLRDVFGFVRELTNDVSAGCGVVSERLYQRRELSAVPRIGTSDRIIILNRRNMRNVVNSAVNGKLLRANDLHKLPENDLSIP